MKKLIFIISIAFVMFTMFSCSNNNKAEITPNNSVQNNASVDDPKQDPTIGSNINYISEDKEEMEKLLKEAGLYVEDEELVEVINYTNHPFEKGKVEEDKNLYAKLVKSEMVVDETPNGVDVIPGGSVTRDVNFDTGWKKLKSTLNDKELSSIIGYDIGQTVTHKDTVSTRKIESHDEVKIEKYPKYEKETYEVDKNGKFLENTEIIR